MKGLGIFRYGELFRKEHTDTRVNFNQLSKHQNSHLALLTSLCYFKEIV